MNKNNNIDPKKQKKSILASLRLPFFSNQTKMSVFEEEQVQSPMKTVINTFKSNKASMTALFVFLGFFFLMTIGPWLRPIDLSFTDSSQINVAPSRDMLRVPSQLQKNLHRIEVGPTFSVGVSKDDELFIWGRGQITSAINIKDVPNVDFGDIRDIAAGHDHIILVNQDNEIFGWGNGRRGQLDIPEPARIAGNGNVRRVYAGYQSSILLTEDGYTTFFGNAMSNDFNEFHPYQGQIQDIILTTDSFAALLNDGTVVSLATQQTGFRNIPENMGNIIDIASTANSMAALNDEGQLFIWGNVSPIRGEANVPEYEGKITQINGGRNHYVAVTDQNEVIAWGRNMYGESSVPRRLSNVEVDRLFVGSYQNYLLLKDGTIETFGHKGYIMGTDDLGRDLFTRIVNGGRLTMTIGAIAVLISTTIATILGGLSGYFGGRIDNVIQRIAEMVAALPFLPFAMILSALIGNRLTNEQRVFMLMIILGVLSWPGLMRLIRAQVLSAREQEYVTAAKALGINELTIVFRHIIPNVVSVIIVSATLSFGGSMLTESGLSFLGFGVQAPQPTWGNILNGARSSHVIQNFWWRWVFASVALSICVISVNLIGEGLRDAIDPKSQER